MILFYSHVNNWGPQGPYYHETNYPPMRLGWVGAVRGVIPRRCYRRRSAADHVHLPTRGKGLGQCPPEYTTLTCNTNTLELTHYVKPSIIVF